MAVPEIPAAWPEAFANESITTIRAFERQLQASAAREKEKLRVIVGRNYHDLILTADDIVQVGVGTRDIERVISSLGQACRPPDMKSHDRYGDNNYVATHVQLILQLLRYVPVAVRSRDILTAAKMLVLTQLILNSRLQKQLEKEKTTWLSARVRITRSKLLKQLDAIFSWPTIGSYSLITLVSAYCLLTSSSSHDCLEHVSDLRLKKIKLLTESASSQRRVREISHYVVESCLILRAFFARSTAEAMAELQGKSLLEDEYFSRYGSLQLEQYYSLLPEDVMQFMPYLQKAKLESVHMQGLIATFTNRALSILQAQIEDYVPKLKLRTALELRKQVFGILLGSSSTIYLQPHHIKTLSEAFSGIISNMLKAQIKRMQAVDSVLNMNTATASTILWQDKATSAQKTSTTISVQDVRRKYLGVSQDLAASLLALRKWSRTILSTQARLKDLSAIRWEDEMQDSAEDENESSLESFVSEQLNQLEPTKYSRIINEAVRESIRTIFETVRKTSMGDTKISVDKQQLTVSSLALDIRLVRELLELAKILDVDITEERPTELIRSIHRRLAGIMTEVICQELDDNKLGDSEVFEAEELPTVPAIRLLGQVCDQMITCCGQDIWSHNAVSELKGSLAKRILDASNDGKYVRTAFDRAYLYVAFSDSTCSDPDLGISPDIMKRAKAYWSRTSVLYGLLEV